MAAMPVPVKFRVLASIVPVLLLMTIVSTAMLFRWRAQYGRLAREKKARDVGLLPLERARELVERVEKYARFPNPDVDDLRSMAEEAVKEASTAIERAGDWEEAYRIRGRALELMYNFDEARNDYEKAATLHPASPANLHLGVLSARQLARARLAGMKASFVDPDRLRARIVEPLNRFVNTPEELQFNVDEKFRFQARACVAYAFGDYKELPTPANAALIFDSTGWIARFLLGLAHFELGEFADAAKSFEDAARASPGTADPRAWLGFVYDRLKRRTDAIAELTAALLADPHFLEAWLIRGTILFEDGRFGDARADFDACARLRPSLPEVQLKLGIACHENWKRTGRSDAADLETAEKAFSALINARPAEVEGRLHRARVRLDLGRHAEAEADLAVVPATPEALELRGAVHEAAKQWDKAVQDYTALIEKAADPFQARRRRARARANAGRLDEALGDLNALIELDPKDAGLLLEKAALQLGAGRPDDALATTDRAPQAARVLVLRAEIFLKKGDAAAAVREATAALTADPQLADAFAARGRANLEKGAKPEALADLKRAIDLRPDLAKELAPLLEKAGTP